MLEGWLAGKFDATGSPYPVPPVSPVKTIGSFLLGEYAFASSIFVSGNDVYAGGYDQFYKAAYWKNGSATQLADTNMISNANCLYIYGTDIYVAGWLGDSAVYWKNGQTYYLPDGLPAQAFSIFVSGTDVYVAGGEDGVARYWKNGISTVLQSGNTFAFSIFVNDGNAYIAGGKNSIPEYWRNSSGNILPLGTSTQTVASSIFVTSP
jgi:hypothetical protein